MVDAAGETKASGKRRGGRVAHLDGIRGIAILSVFVVHWVGQRFPAFDGGYVGVDIFFVLSGFIITALLLKRRPSYGSFMRDRARRLYPPLLGALVGGIVLSAVWPESDIDPVGTAEHAVVAVTQMSSLWHTAHISALDPFSITWSLSIEWYFYLLWPLAIGWLAAMPTRRALQWILGAATVLYVASAVFATGWVFYYAPPARFAALLVGAALAFWLPTRDPDAAPIPRVGTAALVGVAFVGVWSVIGTDPYSPAYRLAAYPLVVAAGAALIASGYLAPKAIVVRLLGWRWLTTLGLVSYSLYLWHILPLALMQGDWLGLPKAAIGAVGIALVVALTAFGYFVLERPFTRGRSRDLVQARAATRV